MRTFTTAARVGVFVATTAAAAVAIVYFIAGEGWSGESYTVYAVFTDAMGLAERSDVQSSGVRVGSIERVSVEQGRARIDLRVDADFPLYVDAAISKTSSGMMGEYVLNVAPGTEGRQRLKDGDRILFVLEASAMDQVMNDLGQISKDLKSVSRALSETFGSRVGKGSNKDTLRQVADATEALNKAVQENRASIYTVLTKRETMSIHGREKVRRTLYKVRESTHELRRVLAASEDSPDSRASRSRERQLGVIAGPSGHRDRESCPRRRYPRKDRGRRRARDETGGGSDGHERLPLGALSASSDHKPPRRLPIRQPRRQNLSSTAPATARGQILRARSGVRSARTQFDAADGGGYDEPKRSTDVLRTQDHDHECGKVLAAVRSTLWPGLGPVWHQGVYGWDRARHGAPGRPTGNLAGSVRLRRESFASLAPELGLRVSAPPLD